MTVDRPPFDTRSVLAHVNRSIIRLRRWLGHDHGDDAFWTTTGTSPPRAQAMRRHLARIATALHVERATTRGRIHGRMFATLDDQRAWLASDSARRLAAEAQAMP